MHCITHSNNYASQSTKWTKTKEQSVTAAAARNSKARMRHAGCFPLLWNCFWATYTTHQASLSWGLSCHTGAEDEREFLLLLSPRQQKRETGFFLSPLFSFLNTTAIAQADWSSPPSCFLSLARCLPLFSFSFFFFFLSCCQLVGWGGHGVVGMWAKVLLLCAAEGNKPKASPSQPQPRFSTSIFFLEEENS